MHCNLKYTCNSVVVTLVLYGENKNKTYQLELDMLNLSYIYFGVYP